MAMTHPDPDRPDWARDIVDPVAGGLYRRQCGDCSRDAGLRHRDVEAASLYLYADTWRVLRAHLARTRQPGNAFVADLIERELARTYDEDTWQRLSTMDGEQLLAWTRGAEYTPPSDAERAAAREQVRAQLAEAEARAEAAARERDERHRQARRTHRAGLRVQAGDPTEPGPGGLSGN